VKARSIARIPKSKCILNYGEFELNKMIDVHVEQQKFFLDRKNNILVVLVDSKTV
jgi:hypothetical protein